MTFDPLKIAGLQYKPPRIDPKYAGFTRRMLAATIDMTIMWFASPYINFILDKIYKPVVLDVSSLVQQLQTSDHPFGTLWHGIVSTPGFLAYSLVNSTLQTLLLLALSGMCWHFWSATPGKLLLGMRIVDADTEAPITDRQIVIRLLGYIVSGVTQLGFFWISIDKRCQGWHDKMANTVVVVKSKLGK